MPSTLSPRLSPRDRSPRDRSPRDQSPSNEPRDCPFNEFGCKYAEGKKNVQRHIKETPVHHLSTLCDGVAALLEDIQDTQLVVESAERRLEALSYRTHSLDVIFSTQLVWRIDDYKKRLNQAKGGSRVTIFSPPFFTGKQGYRLAASAALNGDGPCKGTHMSVFVSVLRSEWDALLPWPFPCRVEFTLLDQNPDEEARRNVTHSVKPNTCKENRPFIGRPVGDRNPSFGIQKFVPLTDLEDGEFVRENSLFLKIAVDTDEIPKL